MENSIKKVNYTHQFGLGMLKRYTNEFQELKEKLSNDFTQISWICGSMIFADEMVKLYNTLTSSDEHMIDEFYEHIRDYILSSFNVEKGSTNQMANYEHRVRYKAKVYFLNEIKPYLSK
jgi:hypothetical protein